MSYSIIFKVIGGSFNSGFKIDIYIKRNRKTIKRIQGILPLVSIIPDLYSQTFTNYIEWGNETNLGSRSCDDGDAPESIGASRSQCLEASKQLRKTFQACMREANKPEKFGSIQDCIYQIIPKNTTPLFVLEVPNLDASDDNLIFQRLPFHTWDWLKDTFHTEVVLSKDAREIVPVQKRGLFPRQKMRILVILGAEEGIDLTPDREAVKEYLQPITSHLEVLEQPTSFRIRQEISTGNYEGIIFSGHSSSSQSGNIGTIKINNYETIPISDIETQLREAQKKGLKFLVLNSCNGLGTASQASEFIDYIIVMREPIHNQVAAIFIKNCLENLAKGDSLTRSVYQAREELEKEEGRYICASWMPIIIQNQEAPDYIPFPQYGWRKLQNKLLKVFQPVTKIPVLKRIQDTLRRIPRWIRWVGYSLIVFIFVILINGWFFPDIAESVGDRVLLKRGFSPDYIKKKEEIAQEFKTELSKEPKNRNFDDIINQLVMNNENQYDPERIWTLNNAKAFQDEAKDSKIKLVYIPLSTSDERAYINAREVPRGAVIAQQEINNDGNRKRNNDRIILRIILDNNDERLAEIIANRMVKEKNKPLAFIGPYESTPALKVADIYQKKSIVMVTSGATGIGVTNPNRDFIFSTVSSGRELANFLGTYLISNNRKKIGFCYDSSLEAANTFKKVLDEATNKKIIISELCNISEWSQELGQDPLKELLDKKVDSLVLYFHFNEDYQKKAAQKIAETVQKKKLPSDFLYGNHGLDSSYVLDNNSSSFKGIQIVTPRARESTFTVKFETVYGGSRSQPTWRDMMAYDALKAIAYGLDQSNGTSEGLKNRMHQGYQNVLEGAGGGEIRFNRKNGDRSVKPSISELKYDDKGKKYYFQLKYQEPPSNNQQKKSAEQVIANNL
jgi:ABC-type branched-subunit amino acid transport system substrate-binding protein